ncbi:hypothetical protein [Streptomyces sp. NPDC056632]|uniref:hypothetical protein n=1 Tax=Streptomyces sp. NPDC056632 TaxID=3345884 RepID=UPI0036B9983C
MPAPSPADTARRSASAVSPSAAALASAETVTAVVLPPAAAPAARPPGGRGRRRAPEPAAGPAGRRVPGDTAPDPVNDLVRWAVFCCVLVPVVLLGYGASVGGAAGTAAGLAAVTAACRVLLRRSERGLLAEARAGRNRPRAPRDHSRS